MACGAVAAVIGSLVNYPLDSSYALLNVLTLPDEARHGGIACSFRGMCRWWSAPTRMEACVSAAASPYLSHRTERCFGWRRTLLLDEPLTGDAARDAAAIV